MSVRSPFPAKLGIALLPLIAAGCLAIPVRMSPQVQGPSGVSADYSFVTAGKTGRDEVLQRLGWSRMDLGDDRLFWGRWSASSSGVFVGIAIPGAVGGETSRSWANHNLLVEFDDKAVVTRVRKIKDKDLIAELHSWSRQPSKPLDFSSSEWQAIEKESYAAWKGNRHGIMMLRKDGLEFWEGKARRTFKVPRHRISSIRLSESRLYHATYILRTRGNTPWGDKIEFSMEAPWLLTFLRYAPVEQR